MGSLLTPTPDESNDVSLEQTAGRRSEPAPVEEPRTIAAPGEESERAHVRYVPA